MNQSAAHRELTDLLARVAEQRVTAADSERLNALLADDGAARALYIDYVVTDAMLRWTDNASAPTAADAPHGVVAPVRPPASRAGWKLAAAIGIGLAIVGVIIAALAPGRSEPTPVVGPKVAVLTDANGSVVIDATGEAAFSGSDLNTGWLSVTRGTAEIAFDSGATVRVVAPARLRLDGANRTELASGRLAAEVPPSAIGFTVGAGAWRVVDLGTSFGVEIGPSGDPSVHVFDGRVRLDGRGAGEIISAGSARRVTGGGLANIPLDRPAFAGLLLAMADATDVPDPPASESLALWLRADRGVARDDDGRVHAWRDLRSDDPRRAVQVDPAHRPAWNSDGIDGLPSIRFDLVHRLQLPTTNDLGIVDGDYEVFVVAKSDDPRIQFLLSGSRPDGNEWYELHVNGDAGVRFIPAPAALSPGAPAGAAYGDIGPTGQTIGSAHVYHARVVDGVGVVSLDGVDSGDTVAMPAAERWAGALRLGVRADGSYGFLGDIAEILIYDSALAPRDRAAVIERLNTRYSMNREDRAPTPEGVEP